MRKNCLFLLSSLGLLFLLRVLGQLLVAVFHVGFLPPMEAWMSGAISYPVLFVLQVCIIGLMVKVCLDMRRRRGYFARPNGRLGWFLLEGAGLYLLIMILRYALRMALYPHERWFGGSLPIFFHCVLAFFLLVWGTYNVFGGARKKWRTSAKSVVCRMLAACCVLVWLSYQLAPAVVAHVFHLRPAVYSVSIESDVPLSVEAGVTLLADVYRPQHLERSPTILVRIPYTKNLTNVITANIIGRLWAERGYTAVVQCTRGKGGSGGKYYPLSKDYEDGNATLHWLSRQPWYDGRVAGWGGSAFGHSQWAIADQLSPGFTAMHIYESSTDIYRMFHPGGAFSLYSALTWAVTCHCTDDLPQWPKPERIAAGADVFPLKNADRRATGVEVDFFNDWVNHSERDGYWRDIDGQERIRTLKAPVLLMAGWYDPFLPSQLDDFKKIGIEASPEISQRSKLVIGPWIHGDEVTFPDGSKPSLFRPATLALSLEWFDRIILGRRFPAQQSNIPLEHANVPHLSAAPIQIFVMGKNVWRAEKEWPLARTKFTDFYLNGRQLGVEKPDTDESADHFVYDPRNPVPTAGGTMIGRVPGICKQNTVEARPDVLCYSTQPLNADMELTGPVKAQLYVSSDAPSTDFTAKLVDVHPDGSAYNICDGILRCNLSGAHSVQKIDIELWPTSMVFFKNHKVRLEVSSSNFPRYDRNPNTGRDIASEINPRLARQSVFHSRHYPSRIILPIISTTAENANRN